MLLGSVPTDHITAWSTVVLACVNQGTETYGSLSPAIR